VKASIIGGTFNDTFIVVFHCI